MKLEGVLLGLLQKGGRTFQSLAADSEGAYPTDVLSALRRLEQNGNLRETEAGIWSARSSGPQSVETRTEVQVELSVGEAELPEAHPLDFDWRFRTRTLEFLYRRTEELGCGSVAILGAPTLFRYLADRGRHVHLFDKNDQVIKFLRRAGHQAVTQCDLFNFSPGVQFQCVVADPPWYLDYYRAFLMTARRLLAPDGKLLLSMLPRLTRPTAEADRKEIENVSFQSGFDLMVNEPASLEYISPPFEFEALKAEGISLPNWRLGDLHTYVMTSRPNLPTQDVKSEEDHSWRTFTVGPVIVKVKWEGVHQTGAFSFQSVPGAADMRLRSVSRRSPLRSRINLWTSRNLALSVTRPDVVCEGLELLSNGHGTNEAAAALMVAEKLSPMEVKDLNTLLNILVDEAKA